MLEQLAYSSISKVYESSLDSSFRAANGVFYTDVFLADLIISDLCIPQDATILDPCCGTGSFLYVANKKKIKNLYGADFDVEAITLCNQYIPEAVFVTADTIGNPVECLLDNLNITQKPDFVIGNPPYAPFGNDVELKTNQADFKTKVFASGRNLFVAALIRSLELVKDGGIVSYIIPKNFLHVSTYSRFRKELLRDIIILSIVDLGIYFKEVRGEQIVLTIKNSKPKSENKITFKKYSKQSFIELPIQVQQDFFKDEILLFTSLVDFEIYKKLTSSYKTMNDIKGGYVGRGKSTELSAVVGKDLRKFGYKSMDLPIEGSRIFIQNIYSTESGIISAFGGNLEAGQTVTIFTDGNAKMCRYILGLLHSRLINFFLYRYCYNNSRLTMHTDAKYLKKIPLPAFSDEIFTRILDIVLILETEEYMSKNWFNGIETLNSIVYKAYELKEDEVNYIDSEVRSIQSKRWSNK